MATRDTQTRIVDAALELFNEHGTAAVSTNRIAEHCGISKGNLHYHFHNKQEIIRFLFQRAVDEMDAGWYRDHLAATLEHMAAMFVRQLQLIRDYRFFYREMADLLRQDRVLRRRFAHNRERRLVGDREVLRRARGPRPHEPAGRPAAAALHRGHHLDNLGELVELRGVP